MRSHIGRVGAIRVGQGSCRQRGQRESGRAGTHVCGRLPFACARRYLPLEGWQSLLASEYSRGTDVPEDARMLMMVRSAPPNTTWDADKAIPPRPAPAIPVPIPPIPATARSRVRSPACWRSRKAFPTTLRISDRQPMTTQMMRWKRPCSRPNRRKPPQCLRPKRRRSYPNPASRTRAVQPNRTNPENRTNPGKRTNPGEPHQSYAQMLVKPDYFPREGDENDKPVTGNADGTDTDSTAVPQNANESRSESQDDEESAPEQAASSQSQDLPKLPHRPSHRACRCRVRCGSLPHRNPARPSTAIHVSSVGISSWKAM